LNDKLDLDIQQAIKTGNTEEAKRLTEFLQKELGDLEQKFEAAEIPKEIKVHYTHTNPETNKAEYEANIEINIETKLQDFISFYQKTNIDLALNFENTIYDIFNRNRAEIEKAIEQNGFDDILIIPGDIPLADLAEKMKMGKGYFESREFNKGGSFAGTVSQNTDKSRIILYHKKPYLRFRRKPV
jgi:hypothetical protein